MSVIVERDYITATCEEDPYSYETHFTFATRMRDVMYWTSEAKTQNLRRPSVWPGGHYKPKRTNRLLM
ncbi:hypothetical protein OUZ56_000960 [Daphnia magna]|uniref:Uncharacterized protein n=1 Tax=Daphnia magna TaxID=35525 RepID=A0ABR0A1U5_9CRUS|nr:hypothetical protein OUZ56_000960 [Daphnia magna]